MTQAIAESQNSIPAIISRASQRLAEARSSGEVLEAKKIAEAALHYARVTKAANETHADCLRIITRAEMRMANEIDRGQDAGDVAKAGNPNVRSSDNSGASSSYSDLGIDRRRVAEWRDVRDAGEETIETAIHRALDEGRAPTKAEIIEAAKAIKAADRAQQGRRENDFYPTPASLVAEVAHRWKPRAAVIWEPCAGDGRMAAALRAAGRAVFVGDIAHGDDFFARSEPPEPGMALCTNPPFGRVREFIDHALAIGIEEMCLVLPERLWASGAGREQFERHRPFVWANMDWREDYLGKGGSPDRALAVAIWEGQHSPNCLFDVWTRQAATDADTFDPETGEVIEHDSAGPDPSGVAADQSTGNVGGSAGRSHSPYELPTGSPAGVPVDTAHESSGNPGQITGDMDRGLLSVGGSHSNIAPFTRKQEPFRPNCLNPSACAGMGRQHCYRCTKAASEGATIPHHGSVA